MDLFVSDVGVVDNYGGVFCGENFVSCVSSVDNNTTMMVVFQLIYFTFGLASPVGEKQNGW